MRYAIAAFALAAVAAAALRAPAFAGSTALDEANAAFARIDDYRATMVVHEISGDKTSDKTYTISFKKPSLERLDVVAGDGKGSGVVWLGGDTVKAHRGGLFSGMRATFKLHDPQMLTIRGAGIDTATIPSMLAHFVPANGTLSEAPGPQINGGDTIAVTLETPNAAPNDVTRDVLYLSAATHFPVRREGFVGPQLVRSSNVTDMKVDIGLTPADFPW